MGVKVPAFLGKLNRAIGDLETVLLIGERSPEAVSSDMLLMAYDLLGEGYGKKGDLQRAEAAWRKVIELAPGTDDARAAEEQIAGLPAGSQSEPQAPVATGHASAGAAAGTTATPAPQSADLAAMIEQAQASIAEGDYAAAQGILRAVIARDSTNAVAYRLLGAAIVYADRGYDKQIAEDTALRTNLVFESMSYLDKAVTLAPDDLEARLLRGIMGVQFPFFVGKLDQGIEDLEMVVASGAPEAMRNQARYHLGFGYQKKGMTYWTQIVNEGVDSSLVRLALQSMSPAVPHFDRSLYAGPIVMIEFVLAFRDELPPQTAVWVQDAQGNLVKTIYISGFSGNAKHVQIVLPAYAGDTEYADADAVTGASIDAGDHIYVWDLKDSAGKPVPSGEYTVKVEVSHWPSMKYQLATASLTVGGEQTSKVVSEGDYIPHLDVRYLPYEVK
jgi:tetratricopeptide (TPR) repeat protein